LKLSIGIAAALIVAWFGFKNPVYNLLKTSGAAEIPATLDYTSFEGWASQPETDTPGAWETPWGVDVFLVYPTPRKASGHGLMDANDAFAHASQVSLSEEIVAALPSDASIYVPKYRAVSNAKSAEDESLRQQGAEDLGSAFDAYLANVNRGRAIMLVGVGDTAPLLTPILNRLQMEDLQIRFAGLVHITPNADETNAAFEALNCSPALDGACLQTVEAQMYRPIGDHLLPRLSNMRGHYNILDPLGTAAAIETQTKHVSDWLDTHAPKPAEPLFGFEAIEVAPVYRPGGDEPVPNASEQ